MALTRSFKETIQSRVERDPAFKAALFREAIQCMLSGDVETGKAILRDYINATIGFKPLARGVRKDSKSLMRMFSPSGNPNASNLFAVIAYLQKSGQFGLEVKTHNQ